MKTIEKNIDYNETKNLYRYRIMVNGHRKYFYAHTYEEIVKIKKDTEKAIKPVKQIKLDNKSVPVIQKYPPEIKGYKYVYFISDGQYCKIGFTKNIKKRIESLQTNSPNKLQLIKYFKTECAKDLENFLHDLFRTKKVNGEWYDILDLLVKR